ncbi:MAG: hypothetical protein HKP58_01540, partial [Desulfatitalea sp.]|nr:hypothetical protein [Desulfatitalea sp.]NNJ99070.1 hypothetical protein [Desulfatitalea sp.]
MSAHSNTNSIWRRLIEFHVRYRFPLLVFIIVGTIFFAYVGVNNLAIHTDFFSLYPPDHPYIKIYKQYRKMFGTANMLNLVVKVKKGDIYNADTLTKVDRLTQAVLKLKGVNPTQVISLTHPKLKEFAVGTQGLTIKPLIQKIPDTADELQDIQKKVYTSEG